MLKNVQSIFTGRFATAKFAIVQRCDDIEKNRKAISNNYTTHWDKLPINTDLIVLAIGDNISKEIWVGKLIDQRPETIEDRKKFGFLVDNFDLIGIHELASTSDADFYGNGGGGGSRVKVTSSSSFQDKNIRVNNVGGVVGEMVRRLIWVRKNHKQFQDPVFRHWEGKCAVTNARCEGLLVASHIKPWSQSNPHEKTDCHNGLLLASSLDALFDRGMISFDDNGLLIRHKRLSSKTARIFGLRKEYRLISEKVTPDMKCYLKWHREYFKFL